MKSKLKNLVKVIMVFCLIFLIVSCKKSDKKAIHYNGYTYHAVQIGNQIWMKENLRTSRYNDGTKIQDLSNRDAYDSTWDKTKKGAYTIYNAGIHNEDTTKNNKEYGKLYNWYAVNTGKLAPKGWHVATRREYEILSDYLGKTVAGLKMRKKSDWDIINGVINTNSSGFSAKPGGVKNEDYGYYDFKKIAYFWTSSKEDFKDCKLHPSSVISQNDQSHIAFNNNYVENNGMSVRCIKD